MADAKGAGKNLQLKNAALTVVAGIRTKGVSIGNEPIDTTTDDEDGIRTFLKTAGGDLDPSASQVDISFDGLSKDDAFLAIAATRTGLLATYTIEWPSGATLVGEFAMVNYEETGAYQDAITFSGELQSSGAWVFTP